MIFLLGAKGFVGSAVLRELQSFYECHGIDIDNYEEFIGKPCDILVNINGNSKKYLAAQDPATEFDLTVRTVIRSVYDFPTQLYVYISSVDVYTDLSNPKLSSESSPIDHARQSQYGFHKWLAEEFVKKTTRSWLITRLGGMLGTGLRKGPVFDIIYDVPLRVNLNSRYQYIHTQVVGQFICMLLQCNITNEIVNICGSGTISLKEIAAMLGKALQEKEEFETQHYEISNVKLRSMVSVPSTMETVTEFLKEEGLL